MEGNVIEGNTLNGTWAGGGGVQIYQMNAIVNDNRITNNTASTQGPGSASHAGGIICEGGTYQLNNNLVARNRALAPAATSTCYGGGIVVRATNLEFHNNRVVENLIQTSTGVIAYGGGISVLAVDFSEHRDMILTGNYIGGNSALGGSNTIGGGIGIRNENPRMENNIIENNSAVNGGGIGIEGSVSSRPAVLVNNTICDNNATVGGGALLRAGAKVAAFNNIFWADTAQSQAEISVSGSTLEVQNCDVRGGYAGTGNIDLDPQFAASDLLFNLTSTSPCIGRGIDSVQLGGVWFYAPPYDFSNRLRPMPLATRLDIGAQEEQITIPPPEGVADQVVNLPARFSLEQNYPNPFNPKTGVRFQVPGVSDVKLTVFDLLGREVAVLVNERKAAGSYEVGFDGSGLASGVYMYRLTAGSFVQSKKMILLK